MDWVDCGKGLKGFNKLILALGERLSSSIAVGLTMIIPSLMLARRGIKYPNLEKYIV